MRPGEMVESRGRSGKKSADSYTLALLDPCDYLQLWLIIADVRH